MQLSFTKMHGLGNDFVVFNAIDQPLELRAGQIRFIADRRFGIGCDQVLLVEAARSANTDFYYRIYNSDGGEVEQCGNGARCFARFVRDKGLSARDALKVGTAAGEITLYHEADDLVRIDMGVPRFVPSQIPFEAQQQAVSYPIELDGDVYQIGIVSMGNPHAVMLADDVAYADVERLGPLLESHALFPQRVNAGFMQVLSRSEIALRVYERGAGETLACGSGACAAVVSGIQRGLLDERVIVKVRGGELVISWNGDDNPVWMTGPAVTVFEGMIDL
ncbi:MAG: diaminopimelate epimerase [Gammaproteobacteria bacterium]|nr:diaminopimelate epimerase [Gammaproteobacteria bacterium]